MINELLNGIKVVKLYAWEQPMEAAITEIRRREVVLIRKAALTKSLCSIINMSSPFLVALFSFATFTLSSPQNVITPQIAFVSLTLFNQLRAPMILLTDLISQAVQVIN
ncbi:unnamed protein product [Anisakis simplex]|uniref:ABC transmembrane type-1 domain-containing protein n=1 Tax=Anisakis simplex TaxID=6269 RepID=A0A0M3JEV1_ANISI|nr:unnamed protein product [Anisakis simplex]